jgi:hypothetical protein
MIMQYNIKMLYKHFMINIINAKKLMKIHSPYWLIDNLNMIKRCCYPGIQLYYTDVTEMQRKQFLMFDVKPSITCFIFQGD